MCVSIKHFENLSVIPKKLDISNESWTYDEKLCVRDKSVELP